MANDKFCNDCYYYKGFTGTDTRCCTYLLKTDKRRPCPPGKDCTVKVPRKVYRRRKKDAED